MSSTMESFVQDRLSIGYLSGAIAAGIVVLQFLLPNALILILVRLLSNDHSAVTWSVVSRQLQNSLWPLLLRSDAVANTDVARRIAFIAWLKPISLFLVAVAAIVTPLGLYDTTELSGEPEMLSFTYIPDTGPMGAGTPPRGELGFARECANIACPATTNPWNASERILLDNNFVDVRVPESLGRLYQSGLAGQQPSLSSFFDVQTRQYTISNARNVNNKSYTDMSYRALSRMVLENDIVPVEGLVVDYISGGIGFRNHTGPVGIQYGAEWEEDLLWWQPETACTDLNVTFEKYEFKEFEYSGYYHGTLVDNGGFVNLNKTNPYDVWGYGDDPQSDPQLSERSYRAAWWTNVLNMMIYNVTEPNTNRSRISSQIGSRYTVRPFVDFYSSETYNTVQTIDDYGVLIGASHLSLQADNITWAAGNITAAYADGTWGNYTNLWNISTEDFTVVIEQCAFYLGGDKVNTTNVDITCGLVIGSGRPVKGENYREPGPGSTWERPVYSCASATKVSIKTVRFRYNSTAGPGLQSLQIANIKDKYYEDDSSKPIWGMEHSDPPTNISLIEPLWGLIAPDRVGNTINMSTIQSDHFYIPASADSLYSYFSYLSKFDNKFLPAIRGPPITWHNVYNSIKLISQVADYSGKDDVDLSHRWATLTGNVTNTPLMINLIWTDIAANAFVGTRSWLTQGQLPPNMAKSGISTDLKPRQELLPEDPVNTGGVFADDVTALVPAYTYVHRVRYRWIFAIPALTVIAITICVCFGALIAICLGATPSRVRYYVWHLSSGRLLANFVYGAPNASQCSGSDGGAKEVLESDTRTWIKTVGKRHIAILKGDGRGLFVASDTSLGSVPSEKGHGNGANHETYSLNQLGIVSGTAHDSGYPPTFTHVYEHGTDSPPLSTTPPPPGLTLRTKDKYQSVGQHEVD